MFSNSINDLTDCHRTKQKKSESECSELSLQSLGYLKKNSTTSSTDSSDLEQEDDGNSTSKIRSGSIVGSMDAISMQSYVEKKLQLFSDSEGNEEDPTNGEDSSSGESDCASDNSQTRGFYTPSDEEPDDLFYLTIPGEPRTALMTPKRSAKNSTKMSGPDPEDKVYQMTSKEIYDRHSFCIPGKGNIFPIELPIGSEAKPRHEPMFGPELAPLNVAAARKVIAATLRPIFALQEAEETRTRGTKIAKKARKAGVGAIEWMLGKGYSKDAVGHETTSASGDSELEWPPESALSFKDKLSSLLKSITNMNHCKSSWKKNAFELEYTKQGSVHRHVMTEKEDFWEMWVRRHTESALVLNEILQNSPLLTLVLQLAIGDGRVGFIAHEVS
ncbi:uncharacterized protein LOC125177888 [Hyalella azteca]|uniref:Uncharacterized protein LOC125177888 n=1 Tax=Hyalella azteca TaxID=294128 RepID=A0A979FJG3_HYAAZ|nr:uncharacterized protein LOC125177888 [Hyalella azteca]